MLRLWPERLSLCILSSSAWLRSRSAFQEASEARFSAANRSLLDIAEELLPDERVGAGIRPVLDIIVSDEVAHAVVLPWQEKLRTPAQQHSYAKACLEDEGIAGADWLMQSGFRKYGHPGIAVALRREIAAGLNDMAQSRRMRLRSVLPLSAAAYWAYQPANREGSVLVLDEGRRLTVLGYGQGMLNRIDVQPGQGNRSQAILRLMRRTLAELPKTCHLDYWNGHNSPLSDDALAGIFPNATVRRISREAWA